MNYQNPTSIRLNKALVQLGLAPSRRKADEMIMSSKVRVNDQVTTKLATTVSIEADKITASGKTGKFSSLKPTVLILNKPTGYVCSHNPQGNDRSIFALLPKQFSSLKIAGRLDKDSEGLVLLTSDGDLANRLSHPRYEKMKLYEVVVDKPLYDTQIKQLGEGVKLHDGISSFDKVVLRKSRQLSITIHEGRNRQIRRTFSALGFIVTKLKRVQLGNISLDNLPSGKYRKVDTIEL